MHSGSLLVAAHFVFGANLDCRNDKEGLAKELQDSIGDLIDCIFDLQTALPLFKVFPTKAYKKLNERTDSATKIGQIYADMYTSDIKDRAAVSDETFHGMSLLEQWLIEGKMSTKEAISHSINMLGAGMDTVSFTVIFSLWSLQLMFPCRPHTLLPLFCTHYPSILKYRRKHITR